MQRDPVNKFYQFGAFHLDVAERLLLKGGQPVALEPKAFDTLVLLVRNNGRLVDKATLFGTVWQNSYVEENALNRSISLLRKALGESRNHKYIETVPKHGYRFVADVVEISPYDKLFILEKHTAAQIITEVEHFSTPDSQTRIADQSGQTLAEPRPKGLARIRRFALPMAGLATCLLAMLAYSTLNPGLRDGTKDARIKSIAVLPFRTIDDQTGHRGLAMADVLITRLSNIKEINVRPTSAVMAFDTQQSDSIAAGTKLGVDAVLEGTIYHANDRVRVTARLIKVDGQAPIWAGQFEKPMQEELRLDDEIAFQVVDALALTLSDGERRALTKRYTENADAFQLYLKGRYLWAKRDNTSLTDAEHLFRGAIAADPGFALAYTGLADKLLFGANPSEASFAIDSALALDPNLSEAYASRGFLHTFHRWNWQKAEADFQKSIELNAGCEKAHQWYATLLMIQRRSDEAKAELRRALEINPLSYNLLSDLGQAHYFAKEFDKAEEFCLKALVLYPDFMFAHGNLSEIYFQTGDYEKAIDELHIQSKTLSIQATMLSDQRNLIRESPDPAKEAFRRGGVNAFWEFRAAGIVSSEKGEDNSLIGTARIHLALGQKDQAMAYLEKALEKKAFLLPFVNADPVYDPLRSDARFQAIMRKMNLGE